MERAIIRSDLTKKEIQPQPLLDQYLEQLRRDIKKYLLGETLNKVSCPVTDEEEVRSSFQKMGMLYNLSQSLGNIYVSPRPSMEKLTQFYFESPARKFWITKLWPQTHEARDSKIIFPQLEWAQEFISQYLSNCEVFIAEYLSNHWGYYSASKKIFENSSYTLVEPLFDPMLAKDEVTFSNLTDEVDEKSQDVIFLFEALDRSIDPLGLLQKVLNTLHSGGLCFITCLLSSGFEVQVLQKESEVFVPPERMNIFSFEGMNALIKKVNGFEILEFSTPAVLDIPNVIKCLDRIDDNPFLHYLFNRRNDKELVNSFQNFLQLNRLGTFGRLVLRKK